MKYLRFISTTPMLAALMIGSVLGISMTGSVFASSDDKNTVTSNWKNPGFYISANGGLGFSPSVDDDTNTSYNVGYATGLGIGYRLGTGFRVEENVSHLNNTGHYQFHDVFLGDDYNYTFDVTLSALTVMTNFIYDFTTDKIFPYIGMGLGYAHLWLTLGVDGIRVTGTSNDFAYQGIAGIGFHVAPQVMLGVQYRYLGTSGDDTYHDNVVEAVLSYAFK